MFVFLNSTPPHKPFFHTHKTSQNRTEKQASFVKMSSASGATTTIFSRFLQQKNGLANVVMASCCLALSGQLLQRRQELDEVKMELEQAKRALDEERAGERKKKTKRRGWF